MIKRKKRKKRRRKDVQPKPKITIQKKEEMKRRKERKIIWNSIKKRYKKERKRGRNKQGRKRNIEKRTKKKKLYMEETWKIIRREETKSPRTQKFNWEPEAVERVIRVEGQVWSRSTLTAGRERTEESDTRASMQHIKKSHHEPIDLVLLVSEEKVLPSSPRQYSHPHLVPLENTPPPPPHPKTSISRAWKGGLSCRVVLGRFK